LGEDAVAGVTAILRARIIIIATDRCPYDTLALDAVVIGGASIPITAPAIGGLMIASAFQQTSVERTRVTVIAPESPCSAAITRLTHIVEGAGVVVITRPIVGNKDTT
jgi:hypothetical protein